MQMIRKAKSLKAVRERERERERESYTLTKKSAVLFNSLTHTNDLENNLIKNITGLDS